MRSEKLLKSLDVFVVDIVYLIFLKVIFLVHPIRSRSQSASSAYDYSGKFFD